MPLWILRDTLRSLKDSLHGTEEIIFRLINNSGWYKVDLIGKELGYEVFEITFRDGLAHLAAVWNFAIQTSKTEWCMISNDDYRWQPGWYEVFCQLVQAGYELIGRDFSCFLISKTLIKKIGGFDENFKGMYFEDSDFFFRCRLAGIKMAIEFDFFSERSLKPWFKHLRWENSDLNIPRASARDRAINERYFWEKWKGSTDPEVQAFLKKWFPTRDTSESERPYNSTNGNLDNVPPTNCRN